MTSYNRKGESPEDGTVATADVEQFFQLFTNILLANIA